jgi:F-type H+-transporting ATPase subunit epsilon
MKVEIITPHNQEVFNNVTLVQLPGTDGLFEILNNHAPLIATLAKGKAKIIHDKQESFYPIHGGVVEVLKNKIVILTEKE